MAARFEAISPASRSKTRCQGSIPSLCPAGSSIGSEVVLGRSKTCWFDEHTSIVLGAPIWKTVSLASHESGRSPSHDVRSILNVAGISKRSLSIYKPRPRSLAEKPKLGKSLATEEMNQRARLQDQIDQLRTQNDWMRTELDRRRLEPQKLTGSRADATVSFPADLGKVAEWAHQAVPGRLTILPRAIKAAKQGLYRETNHAYAALLVLANEYRDMRIQGGPERKASFETSMQKLRLRCEPTFSGSRHGEFGETYFVDWLSQRRLLDMHLKKGGNTRDPTRCLRIYFFWDDDEQQVIVGSLPGHLETRLT